MKKHVLFDNGRRRWIVFGRDPERPDQVIDTNEYVVTDNGKTLLIDPGGTEIFPAVVAALTQEVRLDSVESIFASHQDPDIISSLQFWVNLCPEAKVYLPWVWITFVAHFGGVEALRAVPDEGQAIPLGGSSDLILIPAHYCHSSGNFSLYDPQARILFSGDLGAATEEQHGSGMFVADFDAHIPRMELFHRRWMPSNQAKNNWLKRVRALDIEMLCPQHGSIFRGKDVQRFFDWLEALDVGIAA